MNFKKKNTKMKKEIGLLVPKDGGKKLMWATGQQIERTTTTGKGGTMENEGER